MYDGKVKDDVLLGYCGLEHCQGVPIDVDHQDLDEEDDCPVCYNSLSSGKVTMICGCSHYFCKQCLDYWDRKYVT